MALSSAAWHSNWAFRHSILTDSSPSCSHSSTYKHERYSQLSSFEFENTEHQNIKMFINNILIDNKLFLIENLLTIDNQNIKMLTSIDSHFQQLVSCILLSKFFIYPKAWWLLVHVLPRFKISISNTDTIKDWYPMY